MKYLWQDYPVVFGILPSQQWDLHRFFQTKSDLQPAELTKIREELVQDGPGLPQRAGSAFRILDDMFRYALDVSHGDAFKFNRVVISCTEPLITGKHRIHGVGIARQEPDLKRFAKVLLQMAREAA